ncbi:hypothetical protein I3W98_02515 [Streptomyces cavourensis]|nr:hypothetical protein [Streptomyces cavourensis]
MPARTALSSAVTKAWSYAASRDRAEAISHSPSASGGRESTSWPVTLAISAAPSSA